MLRITTSVLMFAAVTSLQAQQPTAPTTQRSHALQQQHAQGMNPNSNAGHPITTNSQAPGQLGRPGPVGPPQQRFIGPPFQLNQVEQQFVDQILQMWETESAKIKTFNCQFERWEYNLVFGPGSEIPLYKSLGQLSYSKPDKGSFKIEEIRTYKQESQEQPGDWFLEKQKVGEHWVCDGKATYEYNHEKKQLIVRPIPAQMQGQAIVDGPLPFLFGAEAEKLKRRYWIRSKASNAITIHLEAYPRRQEDAANYQRVEVMLDRKKMMPMAIQVHMPNGQERAVYMFKDPKVNSQLEKLLAAVFNAPRTPLGWTRLVEEIPTGQPQQHPGSQANAAQNVQQR